MKHSPAQIYRMMLSEQELEEHRVDVSEAQVRYVWHILTSQIWLRDKDPLLSAHIYANEIERVRCLLLTCPLYEGILPREVAHLGVLLDRMVRCREVETLGEVGSPSSAGSKNDHGPRESLVTPEAGLSSPVQPSKNGYLVIHCNVTELLPVMDRKMDAL